MHFKHCYNFHWKVSPIKYNFTVDQNSQGIWKVNVLRYVVNFQNRSEVQVFKERTSSQQMHSRKKEMCYIINYISE